MRVSEKILLVSCALFLALLTVASPSYAFEKREVMVMGDVTVREGETVEEVSTAWGDVRVDGEVEGGVRSGHGDIDIEGPVGGDVSAGSGNVRINAPVEGDVHVGHGDVYLDGGAQVQGDIYRGSGRLERHRDAYVGGTEAVGMASGSGNGNPTIEALSDVIGWAMMTLGLIAAAVLLAVATPRPLRASARSLEVSPVRSLFLGLGSVPAVIVASILLVVTGIGILLLPLLWPAYLALVLFGVFVTAYFLGRKVVLVTGRYRAGDALAAAVGALLVSVMYLIPILGGLVFAILALLGAGAAISALLSHRPLRTPRATSYASYEDYLSERRDVT